MLFAVEFAHIYQALEKCLELRDKYIGRSLQRLGDNPRDYDGVFPGLDDDCADVSGMRPDADPKLNRGKEAPAKPWTIYPRPPPPHWHWTDKNKDIVSSDDQTTIDAKRKDEFDFAQCDIPGEHAWDFEIDDRGVFQVYEDVKGSIGSTYLLYY